MFGVVLVLTVALIWVSASELLQFIYKDSHYDKPLFVTYFSTSLFTLYLLGFGLLPRWRLLMRGQDDVVGYDRVGSEEGDDGSLKVFGNGNGDVGDEARKYSVYEVFKLGALFAPIFILSNYTFNMGLKLTSVSSSSTISTLSGLFTLILGAAMGVERFSSFKLCAAIVTIGGVALIGRADDGHRQTIGDLLSLAAAGLYAVYTTFLKRNIKHEDNVDMPMLFAFLGLVTLFCWWPLLVLAHYFNVEVFEVPNLSTIGYLTLNALIGTVLADYLWARSVVLTTPLVSTLALSLTAPFALIADFVLGKERFTIPYIIGVVLVLGGFVLVNIDEALSRQTKTSEAQPDPATFTLTEEEIEAPS